MQVNDIFMKTFLHTADYAAAAQEPACHTEMDIFLPPSMKAYRIEQSKRSVCLLRACEALDGAARPRGCW